MRDEKWCSTTPIEIDDERTKTTLVAFYRRERRPIQLTGAGMVKFFLLLCGCAWAAYVYVLPWLKP